MCRIFGGTVSDADIIAEAVTGANASELVWNWECGGVSPNGKILTLSNRLPGVYYITVKNINNGCWEEVEVVIPKNCRRTGLSPGVIAGIAVGVLLLFLLLRRLFKP